MKITEIGHGKVMLIAGGGKTYSDIAARFVRSERPVAEIADSPYSAAIIRNLLDAGHLSALEFDTFIWAVEGYSRVCETQLVRKRHASYLIKSGRQELHGLREYSLVLPKKVRDASFDVTFRGERVRIGTKEICGLLEEAYADGLAQSLAEEDLRHLKPQATEFKGVIAMNARALRDWVKIRMCRNAQAEIRDLASKMLATARDAAPDLFEGAGPSCVELGYCPENSRQHPSCRGRVPTKAEALRLIKEGWR